jgi:hypothetical protein
MPTLSDLGITRDQPSQWQKLGANVAITSFARNPEGGIIALPQKRRAAPPQMLEFAATARTRLAGAQQSARFQKKVAKVNRFTYAGLTAP